MKIQPYFQSGFPYDHDQWISASATHGHDGLSFTEAEKPASQGEHNRLVSIELAWQSVLGPVSLEHTTSRLDVPAVQGNVS